MATKGKLAAEKYVSFKGGKAASTIKAKVLPLKVSPKVRGEASRKGLQEDLGKC